MIILHLLLANTGAGLRVDADKISAWSRAYYTEEGADLADDDTQREGSRVWLEVMDKPFVVRETAEQIDWMLSYAWSLRESQGDAVRFISMRANMMHTGAMRAARTETLFDAIKHGDAAHQRWLHEAIEAHMAGDPVPQAVTP